MAIALLVTLSCLYFSFQYDHAFVLPKLLPLTLAMVFAAASSKPAAGLRRPAWSLVLVLIWPVLSLGWAQNPTTARVSLGLWATITIGLMLPPMSCKDRMAWRQGLIGGALLIAIFGLCQLAGWDPWHFQPSTQFHSFMGNPNASAQVMLLALCLWPRSGYWTRHPHASTAIRTLLLLGIYLAGSRAVWLATIAWGLFATHTWWRNNPWRTATAWIAALALVALCLSTFRNDAATEPGLLPGDKRHSLSTRRALILNGSSLTTAQPLIGIGLGQFVTWYPRYARSLVDDPMLNDTYRPHHAHNLLIESIATLGWPWFLLTLGLLITQRDRFVHNTEVRAAAVIHLALACVALVYLNPVVVLSLLVCLRAPTETDKRNAWTAWLLLSAALLGFLVSLWADRQATRTTVPPIWLAKAQARTALANGDITQALAWQVQHLARDPWSPHSLHDIAVLAWQASQAPDDDYARLAAAALACLEKHFPHYHADDNFNTPRQHPATHQWAQQVIGGNLNEDTAFLQQWAHHLPLPTPQQQRLTTP